MFYHEMYCPDKVYPFWCLKCCWNSIKQILEKWLKEKIAPVIFLKDGCSEVIPKSSKILLWKLNLKSLKSFCPYENRD